MKMALNPCENVILITDSYKIVSICDSYFNYWLNFYLKNKCIFRPIGNNIRRKRQNFTPISRAEAENLKTPSFLGYNILWVDIFPDLLLLLKRSKKRKSFVQNILVTITLTKRVGIIFSRNTKDFFPSKSKRFPRDRLYRLIMFCLVSKIRTQRCPGLQTGRSSL